MSDTGVPLSKRPDPEDEYSATVLASHWVERPAADGETVSETLLEAVLEDADSATAVETPEPSAASGTSDGSASDGTGPERVAAALPAGPDAASVTVPLPAGPDAGSVTVPLPEEPDPAAGASATVPEDTAPRAASTVIALAAPDATPDVVEGTVLRFGPGVTAAVRERYDRDHAATVWHGTLPGNAPLVPDGPRPSRLAGLRRYTLAVVVLVAVIGFLAWQRYGPGLTVRNVEVAVDPAAAGCDGTAVVTGQVETDGRPGSLTYHWVRNDGTTSGDLRERLARGQTRAQLRLSWTFHGKGSFPARAELLVTSPTPHHAAVDFTYTCP